jgi:hypothetical protein
LAAVVAILSWGVFAFGAVYSWGYLPLAAGCALTGAAALWSRRARRSVPRAVAVVLALIVAACVLQELRLPAPVLRRLSPAAPALLAQYDVSFALGGQAAGHALSIDPVKTATGLLLLCCLGVFLVGLTARLDDRLTVRIVQAVIILGGLVAVIAIAFAGNHTGKVYGFWQPQSRGLPFGPFVNRNHFAGWMLMSTLIGFGYFTGLLTQAVRSARSWRQRVVWLSSADGSRVIGIGAALIAMIASLLLSMSRSGIACLVFGLAVIGFRAGMKGFNAKGKLAYASGLVLLVFVLVARVGADGMADRFGTWRDDSLSGRLGAWRDAITLMRQYPVTGTGLNTFGVAMLFHQSTHLDELFAEAHNDYLQLAVEGGLLVGIPALALIVVTCAAIRRRFREGDRGTHLRWIRVGAVTGMLAVAIQEAGDFSLQMPANAAMFCVLAAIALHRSGSGAA